MAQNNSAQKNRQILDKRHTHRLKCEIPVRYQIVGKKGIFSGRIINIGSGGLCMLRDTVISDHEFIKIFFPFKRKKQHVYCSVLRIEGREVALAYEMTEKEQTKFIDIFNLEFHDGTLKGFIYFNTI